MKCFPILIASLSLLLTFSCTKEKKQVDIPITFRALYDGKPLEEGTKYTYGNTTIRFNRFTLYMSPIEAVRGSETEEISDVEYLNFTGADNASIQKNLRVAEGDYTGLRLGFGVRSDLNKKKPSDFVTTHPLYFEDDYWLGWKSYIFSKLEGYIDTDGDGEPEFFFFYHSGSDPVYYTADFNKNFTAGNGGLTVEIDVKKIFTFNGHLFDLSIPANRVTPHNANEIELGKKILGNYANAVTVK